MFLGCTLSKVFVGCLLCGSPFQLLRGTVGSLTVGVVYAPFAHRWPFVPFAHPLVLLEIVHTVAMAASRDLNRVNVASAPIGDIVKDNRTHHPWAPSPRPPEHKQTKAAYDAHCPPPPASHSRDCRDTVCDLMVCDQTGVTCSRSPI